MTNSVGVPEHALNEPGLQNSKDSSFVVRLASTTRIPVSVLRSYLGGVFRRGTAKGLAKSTMRFGRDPGISFMDVRVRRHCPLPPHHD